MTESKYKILKGKTGKTKKVVVEGVKKVLYKKTGSQKLYVMSKDRMMNLVKYKKMKAKKTSPKKKKGGTALLEGLGRLVNLNSLIKGGAKKKIKKKLKMAKNK